LFRYFGIAFFLFNFYYFRYGFQIELGDLRLTERYFIMLKQAMQHSPSTAAGLSIPEAEQSAFAATVAVSLFFSNAKTTPSALASPLRQFARQQLVGEEYALLVVDWSRLKSNNHTAKTDTREFTNKHDVGYDLTAPLVVNASTGSPIALLQAHLKTANGY
jgi:hypothetical protein